MEGAPGARPGPPRAKRPRLEEDAPCGPGPPRLQVPLPLHFPLLAGPPQPPRSAPAGPGPAGLPPGLGAPGGARGVPEARRGKKAVGPRLPPQPGPGSPPPPPGRGGGGRPLTVGPAGLPPSTGARGTPQAPSPPGLRDLMPRDVCGRSGAAGARHPEPVRPGAGRPEPVRPGAGRPEPVRPGAGCPEPVRPEPQCPEPMRPGDGCPEPTHPEPRCPEPVRPGDGHPEPVRPGDGCPEPTHPEPRCPEPARPEPCMAVAPARSRRRPGLLWHAGAELVPGEGSGLEWVRRLRWNLRLPKPGEGRRAAPRGGAPPSPGGHGRVLALAPGEPSPGPCAAGDATIRLGFLNALLVSALEELPKGRRGITGFLPTEDPFPEPGSSVTGFDVSNWMDLSSAFFFHTRDGPKWTFRQLRRGHPGFLEAGDGIQSVVPQGQGCHAVHENDFLLTTFKTSNANGHNQVQGCMNPTESNYVSTVAGTCHIITTEDVPRDSKKYRNSFPKDTLFSVFDAYEKNPHLSNFNDSGRVSLPKRNCESNSSSGKPIRGIPPSIQSSQKNTTGRPHKTNTKTQDTLMEKKQMFAIRSFDSNFNCFLDIEQQMKLVTYGAIYFGSNTINKTREECVGNFPSGGKETSQDSIWNEEKHPIESLTGIQSYQSSNGSETDKEMECSTSTTNTKSSLFMKRKPNFKNAGEINQIHDNQNNTSDRNEHQTIVQENAFTNSKLVHPNNESTELVNQKFKTDLASRINECSPDLSTECLSTETKKTSDFEMKREFDIVLKELCMFHEIGKEEDILANSGLVHSKNQSAEFSQNLKTDLATSNKSSPDVTAECLSTETKTMSDFEMKREFDIVLRELCMFHEIGKEEENSYIEETRNSTEKSDFNKDNSTKEVQQKVKEDLTVVSLEKRGAHSLPCDKIPSVTIPKRVQSSFKWEKIHLDQEKEVPHEYCSSSPLHEKLLNLPTGKDFEKALSQNPALFSDAFMEGRIPSLLKGGNSLSHGIVRVYPLKTCCGPIRIGLSRKAKPKQLHPYLK